MVESLLLWFLRHPAALGRSPARWGFLLFSGILAGHCQPFTSAECFGMLPSLLPQGRQDVFELFLAENLYYPDHRSSLTLAQAGTYEGSDGIREYISFLYPQASPFITRAAANGQLSVPVVTGGDTACHFTILTEAAFTLSADFAPDAPPLEHLAMQKIAYDPAAGRIPWVGAFYETHFLERFFTELGTAATSELICTTLASAPCRNGTANGVGADIWEHNGYATGDAAAGIAQCVSDLASLPIAEGSQMYFDGKSLACRVVHAMMAAQNPMHCPHISFVPLEDAKGKSKCQASEGKKPTDYFTAEDLAAFDERAYSAGLRDSRGISTASAASPGQGVPSMALLCLSIFALFRA
jgi:hypothetical protein